MAIVLAVVVAALFVLALAVAGRRRQAHDQTERFLRARELTTGWADAAAAARTTASRDAEADLPV
jgi:hypothetical protein